MGSPAKSRAERGGFWSLLAPMLFVTAALISGCVSYSPLDIDVSEAATRLSVGDQVRVEQKDSSSAHIKISSIDETELTGSPRAFYWRDDVSIPLSDIESITLFQRNSLESEMKYWFIGAALALVAVEVIFSGY